METNNKPDRIPSITDASPMWENGNIALNTIRGRKYVYYYQGKFDYLKIEKSVSSVQAYKSFLSELPSAKDRKDAIMKKFNEWETRIPDLEFAAWLILQYETAEIHWEHEQWKLEQAAKGGQKSWAEIVKERDERISDLESQLKEKDAIIALKTKEHDEYVANHSSEGGDEDVHIYKKGKDKGDIRLSKREYIIIEYAIHLLASGSEKLSANMKRLIGPENTVTSYINDLKKEGRKPLTDEEKNHIRTVLSKELIDYQEIMSEYL